VSVAHRCKFSDYLKVELQVVEVNVDELKVDGEKQLRIRETSPFLITGGTVVFLLLVAMQ